MKSQLTGKDPDAGKDCGQEEKGPTEDEMDGITDSMGSLSKLREIVTEFLMQNHQLQHSMSPSTGCNSTHLVPALGHHSPVAFRVSNAHTHPGACLLRDHQRLREKQPPPP